MSGLVTTRQAASALGVHWRWVKRAIELGHIVPEIRARQRGGRTLLSPANVATLRLLAYARRAPSMVRASPARIARLRPGESHVVVVAPERVALADRKDTVGDLLARVGAPALIFPG